MSPRKDAVFHLSLGGFLVKHLIQSDISIDFFVYIFMIVVGVHEGYTMVFGHSNESFGVIAVGGPYADCTGAVTSTLGRLGINYMFCDDVYDAVAKLPGVGTDISLLVVAALEEITRDRMRFFDICRARGNVRCCCLVRSDSQDTTNLIDRVRRAGSFVIDDVDRLESLIELLTRDFDACCFNPRKLIANNAGPPRRSLSIKAEATLSRSELNALLGDK